MGQHTRKMSFTYVVMFISLSLLNASTEAKLSPQETYWSRMFPDRPIPDAILNMIMPAGGNNSTTTSGLSVDEATRIKDPERLWVTAYVWGSYHKAAGRLKNVTFYKDIFFLEGKIKKGGKLKLLCSHPANNNHSPARFIPREQVASVPFDLKSLQEIVAHYSVQPKSMEAKTMEETIQHCQSKGTRNEHKHCVRSLESMIDYTVSILGNKVRPITTDVLEQTAGMLQTYTLTQVTRIPGDMAVSCHQFPYTHLLYNCHFTGKVRISKVLLVGAEDGAKVDGVVICHTNTKEWSPQHLAFQLLGVKPGTVPVCHILFEGHVLWVRDPE